MRIAISGSAAKRMWLALGVALVAAQPAHPQEGLSKIKTIVIIYAENRSFDHLYGLFPGANGIANATAEQKTQIDHDGTALPYLKIFGNGGRLDDRFPKMPNEPFRIDAARLTYRSIKSARVRSTPLPIRSRSTVVETTCSRPCRMLAADDGPFRRKPLF
jgi:phospholipase C